jgi:putative pyruvate formate lyase activating enzyme
LEIEALKNCTICPRNCKVNRFRSASGYCRTGAGYPISTICIHQGEEPPINGKNGICNIFFAGCNLHCIYCQNHEISFVGKSIPKNLAGTAWRQVNAPVFHLDLSEVLRQIISILDHGISAVGFVSPSHVVPQVRTIITELRKQGRNPVFVYNTNAYDKVETIRDLEGLIDVFLPDFKYMDPEVASVLSDAPDYPETALASIREMYRLKSSSLIINNEGQAESGLLIRHLVIPGHVENSLAVMRTIADQISTGVCISLMSQYHPTEYVMEIPELNRTLYYDEYQQVVEEMEKLGFRKGYYQQLDSATHYRPDFSKKNPFK